MIKFTMGSSGNQKTHRRKPKRSTKTYMGYQNTAGGGGLSMPAVSLKSSALPSSSLYTASTVMASSCNTSDDNSKLSFSPVIIFYFYMKLGLTDRQEEKGHAKLCRRGSRRATALQVLCAGVAGRYGDSSYVGSKVSLQTDSKSCCRPSWQKME